MMKKTTNYIWVGEGEGINSLKTAYSDGLL